MNTSTRVCSWSILCLHFTSVTAGTESKSLIGIKYSYKIENSVNSRSLTGVFLLACLCNSCVSLFYSVLILDFTDSCLSLSLYIGYFLPLWFKTAVVRARQLPGLFFYLSHLTHFVILINKRPFSSKCYSQISASLETIAPKIYSASEDEQNSQWLNSL